MRPSSQVMGDMTYGSIHRVPDILSFGIDIICCLPKANRLMMSETRL